MTEINKIQLKHSCILHVPIQSYGGDFTFIVNGEEFKTSRLISDLLSPTISKMHLIDPTIEFFTIKTDNYGNFSRNYIPENELVFVVEVIEILGTERITIDIVFNEIQKLET